VLILQGRAREENGETRRAGDEFHMNKGTSHSFTALPGPPLIYAVVVFGVRFPGIPDALG
jgi:hypothetical protein